MVSLPGSPVSFIRKETTSRSERQIAPLRVLKMKPVAFISYSHADSSMAKRLHRWLKSYSIPKRLVGRADG